MGYDGYWDNICRREGSRRMSEVLASCGLGVIRMCGFLPVSTLRWVGRTRFLAGLLGD